MFFTRARARRLNRLALASLNVGDAAVSLKLGQDALALLPLRSRGLAMAADRGNVLLTLSSIAAEKRDHREAAAKLEEAAALVEKFPASRIRDEWLAEVFTRLGDTLRLAGRYAEASAALGAARGLPGWDGLVPLRRAGVLNALGILAKDTGDYPLAADRYRDALSIVQGTVGEGGSELASLHHNLAGLDHVQGRYHEAEPEIRLALELRERSDPPDLLGMAADLSVLGAVLNGQGRLEEAEQALLTAKGIWESRYGPEHYEVAVQLNNLASVRQNKGDFDTASSDYLRAMQIKENVLGREHPEIASLLNNLASLEADRGRMAQARTLYGEALAIFAKTLGPDHPSTRVCAENSSRTGYVVLQ